MNCQYCSIHKHLQLQSNAELKRCKNCTLPITWETISFNNEGICNICRNWDIKQKSIDWGKREKEFQKLVKDAKSKKAEYDCVVPFSGGKDSTFTLWKLVAHYKLKPLIVSFDHGFYRPTTLANRTRTWRKLGVDVITFTPNWKIVKKMMLESLIRKGDFCWHCHVGCSVYPMQIAVRFKIPIVIWGEGGGEYEAYTKFEDLEETDEWKLNRRSILGIKPIDMAGFIGVDIRDLAPFIYPSKKELEGIKTIPLGKYISWDVRKHVEIIKKELGWQEDEVESAYSGLTYEKVECMFQGVRDYIKFLKRGFSRMTHLTTLDIRHGRITRDEGMKLIKQHEGQKPQSLDIFLKYIGINEKRFNEIVALHLIAPAKAIGLKTLKQGKKLHDQDMWFNEGV